MRVVLMIKYYAIRKEKETPAQEMRNTYGICACVIDGGFIDVIECVEDVSKDMVWVTALADKLNQYDVDPIHLKDIVEDERYAMSAMRT